MPLFGRNRRESIAAFPSKGPRVNRRDSAGGATPSPTGSQFNLQLDIMDDIADIKAARKVRMKMWQTEDKEKMCELQSMDGENKQMSRYTNSEYIPIMIQYYEFRDNIFMTGVPRVGRLEGRVKFF